MPPKDYYKILGIGKTATDKEIRQAYRNLAAMLQAEANSADSVTLERIQDINRAYEVLSDPNDRKQFDALIEQSSSAQSTDEVISNPPVLASTELPPPKRKRTRSILFGVFVNLLMLVFGAVIGFGAYPFVNPPPDPQAVTLQKVLAATRHFKGDANAPVTIVEFGDFQ